MTPKHKEILKIAAVPAVYFVALVVFVRLTFPYETLKHRLVAEFHATNPDKRLKIEEISGSGLFGVEAVNVHLSETVVAPPVEGEDAVPVSLVLASLDISVGPLSYLFGSIDVDFEAEVGGGEISGNFEQDEENARLVIEASEVDISELTLLSSIVGLPLGGSLSGVVELVLPAGLMKKAEGKFDLKIDAFTAGDGKAKVRNTIALPKMQAGNLVLKAEAVAGALNISDFSTSGRDFEMKAEGRVRMRDPFDKSALSMNVAFKFKEAYTNQSDLTRGIFGSPDSKIPALFDMDPMARRAKGSDGTYSWQVSGLLAKPSYRPGKTPVRDAPEADEK